MKFGNRQSQINLGSTWTIEVKGGWHDPRGKRHPNKVSTTKYKWYSFLPMGLYEQFRRVANLYFAFHAAITLTPVSPVNPWSTILPLAFVIGVSMAKEGIEDIRRGRSDKDVNNRQIQTLDADGVFRKRRWKQLNSGNIVRVERNEFFPADLLFLFSNNPTGSCYVETANLDGETNLKIKRCLNDTAGLCENDLKGFNAVIQCEPPNSSIYSFRGNLQWNERILSLTPGQILLRGSKLRNTEFAYGVVLYKGYETKIMMNSTSPPSKRSSVERQLDFIILFQILLLICMSATSAIIFAVWLAQDKDKNWYLQVNLNSGSNSISKAAYNYSNPFVAGILQFFTCLVLYGKDIESLSNLVIRFFQFQQFGFCNFLTYES
jgi:phospholipid-translocating ATPase